MWRSVSFTAALLLVIVLPSRALADWKRLQTPNFLFIGDASEGRIRRTAQKLEQFRQVMLAALPGAEGMAPAPTIVFVFQNDRAFTPFKPLYEGRPVALAGYFAGRGDLNYIAVNDEANEAGFGTIFHEYTHFLTDNTIGDVSAWLSEGTAEFYESFEDRDDGRIAVIGAPRLNHLEDLRTGTLMPMRDLIAIDHDSPVYNEGRRRGLFYAQSWALVHYLMLGNPERTLQLAMYFSLLRAGVPDQTAFAQAFGDDPEVLGEEVARYVRQVGMHAVQLTFDNRNGAVLPDRTESIEDALADAYLGDLQARMGRVEEGRVRLERVLDAEPGTVRARTALGLVELRADRMDEALALLERAAVDGPDDAYAQISLGRALVARLRTLGGNGSEFDATIERARAVLDRALALAPDVAEASALAGYVELVAGVALDRATARLSAASAASARAPAREDYRLMLAEALLRQGRFEDATSVLGPLLSGGTTAVVRDRARDMLSQVAAARTRAAAGAQRGDASSARSSVSSAGAATTPPSSRPPPRPVPLLREKLEAETRTAGWFRSVACEDGTRFLVVETDQRTLRLRWSSQESVEFIAYIDNPPASVACGDVAPPRRVLATYTLEGETGDGEAVAIELIPEDFTPP